MDMIEINEAFLWKMLGGIEAQAPCASDPVCSINSIHVDMDKVFTPTFFISGNTFLPLVLA